MENAKAGKGNCAGGRMSATKFGRHSADTGHMVIEARHGLFSRGRSMRVKVWLKNGRWLDAKGKDYTDEIEAVERLKEIKKLEAHLCGN